MLLFDLAIFENHPKLCERNLWAEIVSKFFSFNCLFFFYSTAFLTHFSSILITVVTFFAYTKLTNDDDNIAFSSSNVFTALALFNQLTVPLFIFPITIPIIISCLISTRRIERFLSQPEISKEFEGVRNMARIICKSNESLDDDQKSNNNDDDGNRKQILNKLLAADTIDEEELLMEIKINDRDVEEEARDETFTTLSQGEIEHNKCDANCLENLNSADDDVVILRHKNNRTRLKKQNQLSPSIRLEKNRLKSTTAVGKHYEGPKLTFTGAPILPVQVPDEIIVRIKDGRFSWGNNEQNPNALEIDHLEIPKGIV